MTLRDYELVSSLHDALSARHDRGIEDSNISTSGICRDLDLTLAVADVHIASPLSASRDLVFSNFGTLDISNAMVLGVWDRHTRLLLPSAETPPSSWKSRRGAIAEVVYRRWGDWNVAPVADSARVSFDLAPCRMCARNVRIPAAECPRYAGVIEPWGERWNPCPHATQPLEKYGESPWIHNTAPSADTRSYVGRGILTGGSSQTLGCNFLPVCDHIWRTAGPITDGVASYGVDLADVFPPPLFCMLASRGDAISRQIGGLYPPP